MLAAHRNPIMHSAKKLRRKAQQHNASLIVLLIVAVIAELP